MRGRPGSRLLPRIPGPPSTEILEYMGSYPSEDLHAQWSTNEKVACDVAIGASFEGVRAITAMKHVGLNVASDALLSQSYIGVRLNIYPASVSKIMHKFQVVQLNPKVHLFDEQLFIVIPETMICQCINLYF